MANSHCSRYWISRFFEINGSLSKLSQVIILTYIERQLGNLEHFGLRNLNIRVKFLLMLLDHGPIIINLGPYLLRPIVALHHPTLLRRYHLRVLILILRLHIRKPYLILILIIILILQLLPPLFQFILPCNPL